MSKQRTAGLLPSNLERLARSFARLGWIGVWLQVALATLPIVLLIYVVFRDGSAGRGIDLREYVVFGGLLVLLFTTLWCYRYTRIAKRMLTPERRPPSSSVTRTLWIGVAAGGVGAFISILLLMATVGRLLFVLMTAPQGGMPVIQTATEDRGRWVSAIDMVDLMTMVFTLTAELAVMALSLWLLFRMIQWAATYDRAREGTPLADEDRVSVQSP